MDANGYLYSLGIEIADAAKVAIGRLALAGEFQLNGQRGAVLRPKRGDLSSRSLDALAEAGYAFAVVDGGGFPAVYARAGTHAGESLLPVRALPIVEPRHFPSADVLSAWAGLVGAAAASGEAVRLGVAQMVARLDDDGRFGPELVQVSSELSIFQLGGDASVAEDPFRTAAALLAGFRLRPENAEELTRLLAAVTSLQAGNGQMSGLTEFLLPLLQVRGLGSGRLLASFGAGAEMATLVGIEGLIVVPAQLRVLEPLLVRILPKAERAFTDFLRVPFERVYDSVIVVPPLGAQLSGPLLDRFELAKRGDKKRARVGAERLYVEQALGALADGGLMLAVLPEGLLSSSGHADFRQWLLERARLLAVVSLPPGSCFQGAAAKCSIVLLQKPALDADYPILMVDVEAERLGEDIQAARCQLDAFLKEQVAKCA